MNKRELARLAKAEFKTPEFEALRRRELARGPYKRPKAAQIARMVFLACMALAGMAGIVSFTMGIFMGSVAMFVFGVIGTAVLLFTPDTL